MILKIQNLCLTLERMQVLYERCYEILERERRFLIQLDFENLFPVMREKDEVLAALKALDRDRLRVQDQFALLMQKESSELSLKVLAEILIAEGGDSLEAGWRLLALRDNLTRLMDRLRERIQQNNRFIEKSVSNLQAVASHLSSVVAGKSQKQNATAAKTYTGKAKLNATQENPGSTMEKRL